MSEPTVSPVLLPDGNGGHTFAIRSSGGVSKIVLASAAELLECCCVDWPVECAGCVKPPPFIVIEVSGWGNVGCSNCGILNTAYKLPWIGVGASPGFGCVYQLWLEDIAVGCPSRAAWCLPAGARRVVANAVLDYVGGVKVLTASVDVSLDCYLQGIYQSAAVVEDLEIPEESCLEFDFDVETSPYYDGGEGECNADGVHFRIYPMLL